MNTQYITIALIVITITTICCTLIVRKKKLAKEAQRRLEEQRRLEIKQEEARRKECNDKLDALNLQVLAANKAYDILTQSNKYISNYDTFIFESTYADLYTELDRLAIEKYASAGPAKTSTVKFLNQYKNLASNIITLNKQYVKSELSRQDEFLSNVEGKSLDEQQRQAVIVDEDNSLVVAGAGSGKTLTIAGKVKYLTQLQGISPDDILLISFTSKAAEEMRDRIKKRMNINVSVKTFHKLGLDIIADANLERPSIFGLSQSETIQLLASFIDISCKDEPYLHQLTEYFSYYQSTPQSKVEEKVKFESFKMKGGDDVSYKIVEDDKTTFKLVEKVVPGGKVKYREVVKSYEEVAIANFLFRNRIQYSYEERYQYKTASRQFSQYKPDFYLPEYDVYIEHFGIDKNGNVPKWFKGNGTKTATEVYNEGIQWKRAEHAKNKTTLIESYSWENKEGILLLRLEEKLKNAGIILNPMSDEELMDYLKNNYPHDIDNFTTLVHTFLTLVKSNNKKIAELRKMALNDKRATVFIDLFWPIYQQYEAYLKSKEEIDFNDMINLATDQVLLADFESTYKYIIIDEFQDISNSRYMLIKALLDRKPATKLFCVGDDWQSIYRFAGSDLGIFVKFEDYFKGSSLYNYTRKTQRFLIEKTYRFDDQLIRLSSKFILQNPNQIQKKLLSNKESDVPAFSVLSYNLEDNINGVLHLALNAIVAASKGEPTTVKLLGRYTYEIDGIRSSRLSFKYNGKKGDDIITDPNNPHLSISFNTVHTAKGLEADYVILLNGNSGKHGFPTEVADDPLLNFLLSSSDQFPNGEERRLFYVALTRTRKHIYILSNSQMPSSFVSEINNDDSQNQDLCDWCGSKLIKRKNAYNPGYYYSCSNFQICNFSRRITFEELYDNAHSLYQAEKYVEAIPIYSEAIETSDKSYKAYYERGCCYRLTDMKLQAKDDYSKAISLHTIASDSYNWRARVNFDLGDYRSASEDWKRAYSLNKKLKTALFWAALSFYRLSDIETSLILISEYIAVVPNDKNGFILRAECSLKLRKYRDAYNDFLLAKKFGQNIDNYLKNYLLNADSQNEYEIVAAIDNSSQAIYNAIKAAIANKHLIQFDYQKSSTFSNGEQSKRTVKPEELQTIGAYQSICIKGFCFLRNEDRVFAIERITNLKIIK